ncbi:UDP-glucose 4-epimerase GalE [Vibrio parahaemolyticus]|uniref:UDP-glucose 4-epimerase n=1 Tax=Vibrio parahaemolyticus TaxID=670 RepID=A0A7Y0XF71_VIBPH|nr:UDP-glucose 4-epimerase GalE [Vibrio parahaemolyticus]MDF4555457.1 UDP-glucose 4-epimerase GalE [Vibrio parahaemolyticus]MDF5016970.1 UDP-glucose 4-epimerase GalE [Vibrio parahaemolyticus]MDF5091168.1 UDP-glucose 4-epimerase GalE [Vibrio parahaemolyticus]MDF5096511.1 UDP-glucose 4-epimerase GalE [Vibrio parahaemolyticus]MDF5117206.1 UDP-glucose 4-epimerase GalE [Vibrio parahaemolyticus]
MKVLVTGGLGYIGSHTCVQMIEAGMDPIIIDNLCNAKVEVLSRIEALTGKQPTFYRGDVRDEDFLDSVFTKHEIQAVIHFAGLKAVGESVVKPLEYYDNNVNGSLVLARSMRKAAVKSIVFSSSATVYGDPDIVPITEDSPTGTTTNPYGRSKYMVEECLRDLFNAENDWSITWLRYFNPVGAHPSGTMGEDPQGIPNNLMPFIAQVAVGRREKLSVFGNDYPTPDGTGVRDYIHVMDLADGHIAALKSVGAKSGLHIYNLGTGKGSSVLEMVEAFGVACGNPVSYELCQRRPGDIAECWASTEKAERDLGWKATRSVTEMTADTWLWQSNNPQGYSAE